MAEPLKDCEVVSFRDEGVQLDVTVSPKEDTVWLTSEQLTVLFGRDRTVLQRHLRNIFKEGELVEPSVSAKFAHTSSDGKSYLVTYYNLDAIISLGYRVKSPRGILFRKWASSVLKDYLLKGYVLSERRVLVTDDNYVGLVHRVNSLENRIQGLEEKAGKDAPFRLFYQGEWFEPYVMISEIVQKAKSEIVLIDAYADAKALTFFVEKKKDVHLRLYCSSQAKLTSEGVERFNRSYGGLSVSINDAFHDRFLIIDRADGYLIGSSLNYAGKKAFGLYHLEDPKIIASILALLKEGPESVLKH